MYPQPKGQSKTLERSNHVPCNDIHTYVLGRGIAGTIGAGKHEAH